MRKNILKMISVLLILTLAFGAKDEYVYEFMGLKFKLTDEFKKAMVNKEVAMLDDQSPLDQDLKYAMLTFDRLTEEQRNAEVPQMGDGFMNWINSLERLGTISMFKKGTSQEEISKITKADKQEMIGTSKDGEYEYYLSTNEKTDDELLKEFKNYKRFSRRKNIYRKDRLKNYFIEFAFKCC